MKTLVWGTRVHAKQRVIMIHSVASGRFTKSDMGGQACQVRVGESTKTNAGDILWCFHTHTPEIHTIHETGMCPRKAGMPGRKAAQS